MKLVDTNGYINNKVVKCEIHDRVEFLKSIIEVNTGSLDDYTVYRLIKALDRIEMYNKKIK